MNKTLRNVLYVSIADVLVKVVSASATFVVAKMLTPEEYGRWVTLILIVSYAPIVALGTMETLIKQYPFYSGRGDLAEARRVEEGVFGSVILASLVLLVAGLAVVSTIHGVLEPTAHTSVRVTLLTGGVSLLSAFFYYRFSARQDFRFVSMIDSGRSVITAVCLVGLTYAWRLMGTVAGYFLAEAAVCALSAWLCLRRYGRLDASFNPSRIWRLVGIGFPITIIWWLVMLQASSDRWISIWLLGESATGYYGLGVSIVSLLILLPVALSKALYPRVNEKVGETSRQGGFRSLVVLPSYGLSVLIPAAIGMLVFALPVVYRQLLPKYGPGLASAQILLLGSFFSCIVRTGANFLIAIDRQHTVLRYVVISLAVNVTGNILLAASGFGIEGIAFGTSVSACVLATLVWLAVFKHMGGTRIARVRALAGLYVPYVLMLSLLALCAGLVPGAFSDARPRLLPLGVSFLLMFSLMVYALPMTRRRVEEVGSVLRAHVTSREKALSG